MTQFRYLIGYVVEGGRSFGRVDMARSAPIVSNLDVEGVERDLRAHLGEPTLIVLSFSRYADAEVGERA